MKTIPKKYLSSANCDQARKLLRKWILELGETNVINNLLDAFRMAQPSDYFHLGTLMAMVFDMRSKEAAQECVALYGIEVSPKLSIGEMLLVKSEVWGQIYDCIVNSDDSWKNCENGVWRQKFCAEVGEWTQLLEVIDAKAYPLVISSSLNENVLTISKKDAIYAFRGETGSVCFVIIDNTSKRVLIDEDGLVDGEYPLYFTDQSHFVSPVFKLRVVNNLFNFILSEIGYPSLRTDLAVVFNSYNASFVNYEDYAQGGVYEDKWEDIKVYMRKDYSSEYMFTAISKFFVKDDIIENEVISKLLEALAAVSILYQGLDGEGKLNIKSLTELRKYSKKYGIFPKKNKTTFNFE